jgi:hypothetical protein
MPNCKAHVLVELDINNIVLIDEYDSIAMLLVLTEV